MPCRRSSRRPSGMLPGHRPRRSARGACPCSFCCNPFCDPFRPGGPPWCCPVLYVSIIYNSVIISRFKITNISVIILLKLYIYRIIYKR
nr:MAG TPA: hypothetical protein [Caudoviricetes sp.]